MRKTIRTIFYSFKNIYINKSYKYHSYSKIHWGYKGKNFGDILNPILFNLLTSEKAIPINAKFYKYSNLLMIGSILQHANKHSKIWGSGFISDDSILEEKPLKVYAVRGKLSRKKLLLQGIECPEVYGDPALLMPLVYNPKVKKKYNLGVIPHYVDKNHLWLKTIKDNENVLIIDIITDNPLNTINQILSCKHIASSSLHGLIMADTYDIPSIWINFNGKIVGGNFKFHDYFSSVGKELSLPYSVGNKDTVDDIINKTSIPKLKFNFIDFIDSAPFKISNTIKKAYNETK